MTKYTVIVKDGAYYEVEADSMKFSDGAVLFYRRGEVAPFAVVNFDLLYAVVESSDVSKFPLVKMA